MEINPELSKALDNLLNEPAFDDFRRDLVWSEIKELMGRCGVSTIVLTTAGFKELGSYAEACKQGAIWIKEDVEKGTVSVFLPVEP